MKFTRIFLSLLILLFASSQLMAQRHRGHHHQHRNHRVVIKRSAYRPAKVVVYHPHWRPAYTYHRRWVYFPRYNFYWDNWRNHYVFLNGNVWVSQPQAPVALINVSLDQEKSFELREHEDEVDDVYQTNPTHQTEYKNE